MVAAAKKEKVTKEVKEGERKSSRTSKVPERLTAAQLPPTILKKKPATKKTPASPTKAKATKGKATKKAKKEGPKKAATAFILFSKDNRAKIQKANPDASFGDIGKLMGEAWADATAADKKKYTALAEKDKVRYEKEKKAFAAAVCFIIISF